MLSLCIDTAYKYLTVCLIKDDTLVDSISYECSKRQSEEVFISLDELFKKSSYKKEDIDSICITKGPGSYTGVRIAMSLAKVTAKVKKIDLYTISTLRLYAGNNKSTMVIMNARSNRAYVGAYDNNEVLIPDQIMTLDEIDPKDYDVVLDGSLIGKEDTNVDIPSNFLKLKPYWEKVDNINFLCPEYLKENSAYLK